MKYQTGKLLQRANRPLSMSASFYVSQACTIMAVAIKVQMQKKHNNLNHWLLQHLPLIVLGLVGDSKTFHAYTFATTHHFSRWALPDNKGTPLLRRILFEKTTTTTTTKKQDSNEVGYVPPRQISF